MRNVHSFITLNFTYWPDGGSNQRPTYHGGEYTQKVQSRLLLRRKRAGQM